jgi:hypothetical protein
MTAPYTYVFYILEGNVLAFARCLTLPPFYSIRSSEGGWRDKYRRGRTTLDLVQGSHSHKTIKSVAGFLNIK